ncbi:hypothetical protein BDY21DRAFT_349590 [Lineolata rhizophorae]|uniref:Uncharacterized protein n=1 Tax=Lineolata rhizophorae TaxID=578093 RepID=A0A6A6NVD5_9PEZI|nr:hypothetical protein BDY21DRAFT_349590 [Lineolata rhizophorae]
MGNGFGGVVLNAAGRIELGAPAGTVATQPCRRSRHAVDGERWRVAEGGELGKRNKGAGRRKVGVGKEDCGAVVCERKAGARAERQRRRREARQQLLRAVPLFLSPSTSSTRSNFERETAIKRTPGAGLARWLLGGLSSWWARGLRKTEWSSAAASPGQKREKRCRSAGWLCCACGGRQKRRREESGRVVRYRRRAATWSVDEEEYAKGWRSGG